MKCFVLLAFFAATACTTLPSQVQIGINTICANREKLAAVIVRLEKTPNDPVARDTLTALNAVCPLAVREAQAPAT